MEKQWRSSPQPSEQEPPAAQQAEAIPGADAAPEEMPHEEEVCEKCGRPYGHARKLGELARSSMPNKSLMEEQKEDRLFNRAVDATEAVYGRRFIGTETRYRRRRTKKVSAKDIRVMTRNQFKDFCIAANAEDSIGIITFMEKLIEETDSNDSNSA
ncbi:hypothetical protein [uncultured Actinomyces sp.]|uniref:hypothetical protein n=1 Tax=uncultured Actinomyces sp. TaxID=249061 RepID=UPI00261A57AF|nr:hypothetical protein [uncultured Actinomyces sp.]